MQLNEDGHSPAVSISKKLTTKGIRYSTILSRIYERDGVKFFQSCCDLCFCENGILNDRKWKSMSNEHIDVELQTTGDGKTRVALKTVHMNIGYLVFSVCWAPIAITGIWFFILLIMEAATGRGSSAMTTAALFFRISAPLLGLVLLWIGYKRHCTFIENGFNKLLTAMQKFPADINLEEKDYNTMLDALPVTDRGLGFFKSYGTETADVCIKMDTPMYEVCSEQEGYLYRNYEDDVDVIYVPRPTDTLLLFRARPDYPLGILIGVFIALWISWLYFLGYKYVIKYGASTTINDLALAGFFVSFLLMLLVGFGILLFRKIKNDKAVKESMSTVKFRLESNQQGVF